MRPWDELITSGGNVGAIDISPSVSKLAAISGDKIQPWHLRDEPLPEYREK
ncbi:MAG: hypothetical protein KDM63_08775 [Verrucomicrobiae bacterium]|nr:hypothetical protein [Verrucomicrobiae bacterium]